MTRLAALFAGLACALSAQAQLITSTVTIEPWTLFEGSAIVQPRVAYPNSTTCVDAARQLPVGSYACWGSVLVANVMTLPPPAAGSLELRVRTTTEQPIAAAIGAFRTLCKPSHYLRDDPLVHPGKPGASHLHTFFGNTSVNAFTTGLAEGASTCLGGIANRSAYWVPTMLDARGGVVVPETALIYYKRGHLLARDAPIAALPPGLRMVAGDPQPRTHHECIGVSGTRSARIPACPVGKAVWSTVLFPQCWNGRDLDSADHRSHMAYPQQQQTAPYTWRCPTTHPVALPEITIVAIHPSDGASDRWRLASDSADKPNGRSMHADWWNGWDAGVMAAWLTNCVQVNKDCHAHLLGDGRALY
jgi:hypothetical protein